MSNSSRGMLFLLIGAYIAYMGVQMYQNTLYGISSMSMSATILLMAGMIAAGVGVIIYGIILFVKDFKEQKQRFEESENNEEEDE